MKPATNYNIPIIGAPKMEVPSLSRRTHEYIRTQIHQFLNSNGGNQDLLLGAVRALDVLPLSSASDDRWYGLRPDGDLLTFELNDPYREQEEEDQWRRTAVLLQASERYPDLMPLVPPPPLSCYTCPRCGGSGTIQRQDKEVLCICEGVGWLPAIEDETGEGKRDEEGPTHQGEANRNG